MHPDQVTRGLVAMQGEDTHSMVVEDEEGCERGRGHLDAWRKEKESRRKDGGCSGVHHRAEGLESTVELKVWSQQ